MIQLTQFAESSGGIGALGVDGKAFVIQLVTFVIAFWVLKRYAFEPIIKMMDRRRATIEQGVTLGEQMKKDQAALEAKVEKTLHETRAKADGIIAQAQETARGTIREAEDKAKDKAAGIVAEAEARIKQDAARARAALEKEVVGLISDATEAIIGEKVDAKKDAQLIDRALKERA
ncbi:MAG TPA: F0F1 ATP synthase subunit B [Candidatus Saccharimonadales bacterium]|nr:F0F1 ATP synthase subunit B [Candidatus Saccharimonadales bacterium]